MAVNAKTKGQRGEYAVRDILQEISNQAADEIGVQPIIIQRNLEQARSGGHDLLGTFGFAVEVKNYAEVSNHHLDKWWTQAVDQAKISNLNPLLVYKVSRSWRVQLRLKHVTAKGTSIKIRSDISLHAFKTIFKYECLEGYIKLKEVTTQ